ncbi:uncharacterized protein LOC131024696 isoform X2 [Salvia miltiorrhiza]|uniref:uncharacterized protein LOC131024696 isoform X2 n=1 Tax=Salvia miltiorrhiza TaxID=226208 RepID=UPI0025AD4585|nr:uncharacterized protein LOC131024696 isoform X2 [Salvia miltiorrhiza]
MEPMIDPSSSIPELIKFIKYSFRKCEFDEVQNTLMEREKSMKVEMEKLVRECDELKKQVDFLERSKGYSELEKCDLEEKLRESQKKGEELDKMIVQTNEKFEKLRSEKHDVENELVRSIGKCEEMDERLAKMGKEIEELRRESLCANKTIEELKAKEIEADRVVQELKRQNNEAAAAIDTELEKNMQNGEVNPEEDRATESPEFPAISGSHASVMQSGGEVPAEKTVSSSSAAGKVVIVICDSDSDGETCIPDTSSGQTKRRKISTSATPSNCHSLPSSRIEERAGALQKSRTGHRIDSTDSDDSISAGYTNNLIATIESKGNNKKGTAALPPPRCPLLSPHCSLAPSRCTTPVVEHNIAERDKEVKERSDSGEKHIWSSFTRENLSENKSMAASSSQQADVPYLRSDTIDHTEVAISTYYRDSSFPDLMRTLILVGNECNEGLLGRFRESCFGHFTDWRPGMKSNRALHHIVSRQIVSEDDEMCFFLCGARVRFSPTDYALVTGLNFGPTMFDATLQHDCSRVEAYRRFCGGRTMTIHALIKRVCNLDRRVDDEDGSLYLRAVLVCVAHTIVLGLDTRVQPWLWVLVDDLDAFDRFPWGAYSYKTLCHYTTEIGTGEKYHFYGPSWALYVWALERVPGFEQMVAASSGDPTAYPRCLRWNFRGKPRLHGLRDLFEGQGGVLGLNPDQHEMKSNYFISALTPGELSVRFKSPENPLARGVQFPQHTRARVVEERGDEEDVARQPRMTRSQSVRGPVRDARPHEPARHSVDPGNCETANARFTRLGFT